MTKRIVLGGICLSASLGIATAGEAPGENEKCVGPMCLFTPIYRLGKTVMPAAPEHSDPPAGGVVQSNPDTEAPKSAPTPAGDESSPSVDKGSGATATDKGEVARDDASAEKPNDNAPRRLARQTQRHVARTAERSFRVTGHTAVKRVISAGNADRVTVSAAQPEMGRMLALASMVDKPSISVVPEYGLDPGCSTDFVVDTLSNSSRLGPAIPLFSESLVIVARKDVSKLGELRGRRVSFGPAGGSSERVAQRLFGSLHISVQELTLDFDNALDGLALGELDAVALLVPRGYNGFSKHAPQLHLLGLEAGMVPPEGLRVSRITPSSYLGGSWLEQSLLVIAVDAALRPNREAKRHWPAMSLYAALDRGASRLAQNGFDLIGEEGQMTTMRSVAEDQPVTKLTRVDRSAVGGCRR